MRGCRVRRPGCGQGEAAWEESWSVLGVAEAGGGPVLAWRCGAGRGGNRLKSGCEAVYHPERARSRLIWEAKQGRAWLVLGWETAWEYWVL